MEKGAETSRAFKKENGGTAKRKNSIGGERPSLKAKLFKGEKVCRGWV